MNVRKLARADTREDSGNVHGSLLTRCRYIVVCTTIMPRSILDVNSKMRPVSRFVGKRGAVSLVMAL